MLPNVVIAGAPKCGTSSLYKWLAAHPQICGSKVKEPFYLMDEDSPLLNPKFNYYTHKLEGYQTYFDHCCTNHSVVFEATTHYIYQQTALRVLVQLETRPKIIFIVRKPSERVYSSYQFTINSLANLDRSLSFTEYVNLVQHNNTESLQKYFYNERSAYVLQNDVRYSQYVDYISLWVEKLGQARILVCLFEKMKMQPKQFMKDISNFIQIDPGFYDNYEFDRYNETVVIKQQSFHRQVRRISAAFPPNPLKNILKIAYLKLQTQSMKYNRSSEELDTLSMLDKYFLPFNAKLEQLLNLDISLWE